ncbi:MAG TPA: 5'/3'-nucleotidase SurE [Kiritimatiellia bacterium]|nr:5'/3'-nucleotidase SurE [Kiritimatiellia bacterium]
MRILICNDDGIHAPGIHALYHAVKDLGDVTVAAPDRERSAVGHAITISDPIKCKEVQFEDSFKGYAIGGTPADCVKLAVYALVDQRPDLIISGINLGPNAGISVIYSGTVSAATEGTILGIPSIAISLNTFQNPNWDTPAKVARAVAQRVIEQGLPEETLLNVNVPNLPWEHIKGYKTTSMGRSRFEEVFHHRTDPRGNVYYWMDGELELHTGQENSDVQALEEGFVSLTPIWFDLTNYRRLDAFRETWSDLAPAPNPPARA